MGETMNAALRILAGLPDLAEGVATPSAPTPRPARKRPPKVATPPPPAFPDDAAWRALVAEYAALNEGIKPLVARLEELKDAFKSELAARSPLDGGEGAEIRTSAGIVGMRGCDVREYVVAAYRRRSLTVR